MICLGWIWYFVGNYAKYTEKKGCVSCPFVATLTTPSASFAFCVFYLKYKNIIRLFAQPARQACFAVVVVVIVVVVVVAAVYLAPALLLLLLCCCSNFNIHCSACRAELSSAQLSSVFVAF